jgi:hypothetical protein
MRDEMGKKYHYMPGGNPEELGIVKCLGTGNFIVPGFCKTGTPLPLPSPLKRSTFRIRPVA